MNHSGAEDTVIDASPLGTLCSTQIIMPFPKNNSTIPLITACLMLGIPNNFSPLIRHQAVMKNPAIRNRSAPRIKGGKSPTAILIKKYVEPHTMYTMANAMITMIGEAVLLEEGIY